MPKHYYTNDIISIKLDDGDPIPEGFHRGAKKSNIKYIYYTDGTTNLRVPDGTECPEGFYKGRTTHWSDDSKQLRVEKAKKTCLEKYGNENYNNVQKSKETKLSKYGNENYRNDDKIRQTCTNKYGCTNPFGCEEIKEKIKNTKIERYGYVSPFSNPDISKKAVEKSWSDESREQRIKTFNERYGINGAGIYFGAPDARDSQPNIVFKDLLIANGFDISDKNRERYINHYRYDFCVSNVLIEINPTITHNTTFSIYGESSIKDKNYHFNKSKVARDNGYRCIHVFDWDNKEKIVELLKEKEIVYGRKCIIKDVSVKEAREFITKYHLQNYVNSSIRLGLYYEDNLVSIMTFGKSRYNKSYQYELLRYCSSKSVIGGAEKLFKHFLNTYTPSSIISYCDLSKFNGYVYEKLGFTYVSTSIGKHWYNIKTKQHITDNLLRTHGFDRLLGKYYGTYGKGTSNEQLMLEHGFLEVYDAGQSSYSYILNK